MQEPQKTSAALKATSAAIVVALMAVLSDAQSIRPASAAEDKKHSGGIVDTVAQWHAVLERKYLWICKNETGMQAAGWTSQSSCLQDGRPHLVYVNDRSGRPGSAKLDGPTAALTVTFGPEDLNQLLIAATRGATVSVWTRRVDDAGKPIGEVYSLDKCLSVGLPSGSDSSSTLSCSTAERIHPWWNIGANNHVTEANRYSTDGKRQNLMRVQNGSIRMNPLAGKLFEHRWIIEY